MGESGRSPGPLDLTVLSRQFGHDVYNVTVTPREHPEERVARLQGEKTEAEHRRRIFWVVFAIVILAGVATFAVIVSGRPADAETQAWARAVGSAIIGGIVGYFSGSSAKPRS